jgi:hypothetical protein
MIGDVFDFSTSHLGNPPGPQMQTRLIIAITEDHRDGSVSLASVSTEVNVVLQSHKRPFLRSSPRPRSWSLGVEHKLVAVTRRHTRLGQSPDGTACALLVSNYKNTESYFSTFSHFFREYHHLYTSS